MKIYHLADLHFGKKLAGYSMEDDQKHWVKEFLQYCSKNKPDAVVIAGDVYDRANPTGEAILLLDSLLTGLADQKIKTFLISGNHDSGTRISFAGSILSKQNIYVAGRLKKEIDHVTIDDPDGNGPVTFWMLPYTFPEEVSEVMDGEEYKNYDQAIRSLLAVQDIDTANRNIMISHQNVVVNGKEVERSGSETMVGGVGMVDYTAYDSFDYVALGHIHSSYHVGREEVRYAGTPLCYHMNETKQGDKGFLEVNIGAKGEKIEVNTIPIKPLHKMRYYPDIKKDEIFDLLEDDPGRNEYFGIVISDQRITPEIDNYLNEIITGRGSILMELTSSYNPGAGSKAKAEGDGVESIPEEDRFAEFFTAQNGGTPPTDEEYELMTFIGELVRNQDSTEPITEDDVLKIINKAKSIGGETE